MSDGVQWQLQLKTQTTLTTPTWKDWEMGIASWPHMIYTLLLNCPN
jgi:hypothetical protein